MVSFSPRDWNVPPDQLTLETGDVHIWRVDLQSALHQAPTLNRLLSSDETSRARRFRFVRDRNCYVTVRGILRVLLGAYLQISPQRIKFYYGTHGKPTLASKQTTPVINFNVSHSHELALLAFTDKLAVGIDLEYIRPELAKEQLAERFFSSYECTVLRGLPVDMQSVAFFNCWTRKEAFIKATGDGLSRALDQFSVSLVPGEPASLLEIRGELQEPANWLIQELDMGSAYAGALAVHKPVNKICFWDYSLDQKIAHGGGCR